MCDEHSSVLVEIPTASERGEHGRQRGIDGCIAPLIDALNQGGVATVASCCGHNKRPGSIVLADGRELRIFRTFDPDRLLLQDIPSELDRLRREREHYLGEVDRYRQALEEVDSLRIQMALVVNTALSSGHAVLSGRAEGETT